MINYKIIGGLLLWQTEKQLHKLKPMTEGKRNYFSLGMD